MVNTTWLYWGIGLVAAYEIYVTIRVTASPGYSRSQKLMQAAIIWFVPFLGALLCHGVLASDAHIPRKRDTAFSRDEGDNPPGIGSAGPHV